MGLAQKSEGSEMSIRLLAFGNNYKGTVNELPDCEIDANNVTAMFKPFCASVQTILSADRDKMREATKEFLASLVPNDLGILYYSGHGTTDKVNGKNAEAIVCNDFGLIYDFELRADLNKRADDVMLAMAADSCYSGGLSRITKREGIPRVIPANYCVSHNARRPSRSPTRPNAIYEACSSKETASSTGKGGAWTLAFMKAFSQRQTNTTLTGLHKQIIRWLPSRDYPQHPAFEIDNVLKNRTLKSFIKA